MRPTTLASSAAGSCGSAAPENLHGAARSKRRTNLRVCGSFARGGCLDWAGESWAGQGKAGLRESGGRSRSWEGAGFGIGEDGMIRFCDWVCDAWLLD